MTPKNERATLSAPQRKGDVVMITTTGAIKPMSVEVTGPFMAMTSNTAAIAVEVAPTIHGPQDVVATQLTKLEQIVEYLKVLYR